MNHHYYIKLLGKIARAVNNSPLRSKHASAIVLNNEVISVGVNQKKSHPLQSEFGVTKHNIYLHAEIAAINNAIKNRSFLDLSKAYLYIVRIRKETVFGWSLPCSGCLSAIAHYKIKNIIHSVNDDGQNYAKWGWNERDHKYE